MRRLLFRGLVGFMVGALPLIAGPNDSLLGATLVSGKSGTSLSVPMQIVLLLTVLTLLPAIVMSVTPFLRIVVVLHFLRQALGTQTTPSNQVLVGLALFLSLVIVQPVAEQIYHDSWQPLDAGQIGAGEAWERASGPIHGFLIRFAREKDLHGTFACAASRQSIQRSFRRTRPRVCLERT